MGYVIWSCQIKFHQKGKFNHFHEFHSKLGRLSMWKCRFFILYYDSWVCLSTINFKNAIKISWYLDISYRHAWPLLFWGILLCVLQSPETLLLSALLSCHQYFFWQECYVSSSYFWGVEYVYVKLWLWSVLWWNGSCMHTINTLKRII